MNKILTGILSKTVKWGIISPLTLSRLLYFRKFHKFPNLTEPQTLNEKILHLGFFTDTAEWTRLSDKYLAREFVEERGFGHTLTKLYGSYTDANEIDFDALPQRFVMKSNNGYGTVILVDDKNTVNHEELRRTAAKWLKSTFGYATAEPHYTRIKPRIIIEEYLDNDNDESSSIVDYKFWCFDGKVANIFVCANRNIEKHSAKFCVYSANWQPITDAIKEDYLCPIDIPRPERLEEMLRCAEILSKGFPIVRVDLYSVRSKIYFGEMSFTSNGGRMTYFTNQALLKMGAMAKI